MKDRASDSCLTIAGVSFAMLIAIVGYQWNNPDGWLRTTVVRQRDLGVRYQKIQKSQPALAKQQTPPPADVTTAETESTVDIAVEQATETPR